MSYQRAVRNTRDVHGLNLAKVVAGFSKKFRDLLVRGGVNSAEGFGSGKWASATFSGRRLVQNSKRWRMARATAGTGARLRAFSGGWHAFGGLPGSIMRESTVP